MHGCSCADRRLPPPAPVAQQADTNRNPEHMEGEYRHTHGYSNSEKLRSSVKDILNAKESQHLQ